MNEKNVKKPGIAVRKLLIPMSVLLFAFLMLIVFLVFRLVSTNNVLLEILEDERIYKEDATALQATVSQMSENATSFILIPYTENRTFNQGPLVSYAAALQSDTAPDKVLERFRGYDVPERVVSYISAAAEYAGVMFEMQQHAMALLRSVDEFPDIPAVKALPEYTLPAAEQALPFVTRESNARSMILSGDYSRARSSVLENVTACTAALQAYSDLRAAETSAKIASFRTFLGISLIVIAVIMIVTFIILSRFIIVPLQGFARRITENDSLDDEKGFKETRLLASAYNALLKRRAGLEALLRSAAETDALTSLSNRYSLERFILENDGNECSGAALMFDMNYLKKINDTLGHGEGDKALRAAAECITECFGKNSYRIGGDEFAAIVTDCTPESIAEMTLRFGEMTKDRNVSICIGCAYADDLSEVSLKDLIDKADRKMYEQKQAFHKQAEAQ